eukprot:GFKZ01010317.1.p1 GENE.GFKZ01010317.1~~GFKZ01010317.1.p1  ORF type:complete len:635 (+),score=107.60 GFKZ01010317.1:27-1907(+)
MPSRGSQFLLETFDKHWKEETTHLCRIRTFRTADNEPTVRTNLRACRSYLHDLATSFTAAHLTHLSFTPFEWAGSADKHGDVTGHINPPDKLIDTLPFWVFGFRLGPDSAPVKISLVCHLDTVPASDDPDLGWFPFEPEEQQREYEGSPNATSQTFLVGRGCQDDKGPASSAFCVFRALAKAFDGTDIFEGTQVEVIFDTSEETDMSTPKYWLDPQTREPDFGIVYDAMWCVRAEKGGERPVFWVPYREVVEKGGIWVRSLLTSEENSTNTIADWARAEVAGEARKLEEFAEGVQEMFTAAVYDDEDYYKGKLGVTPVRGAGGKMDMVVLEVKVEGAQHGSAPEENRAAGVNPLVSLGNFVAWMAGKGVVGGNQVSCMAQFLGWMWGTNVFGEGHESLYATDDVFIENNGTTYGVTKMWVPTTETVGEGEEEKVGGVQLEVDIRYAMGHHSEPWDEVTEGYLPGKESRFGEVFTELVGEFNRLHPGLREVKYGGVNTLFAPDIRVPDTNEMYQKSERAFREVMGVDPPRLAIGGGTDAKGNVSVLALGPLFDMRLGPPINYHGISEGSPMIDMRKSTEIMYLLCELELTESSMMRMTSGQREKRRMNMLAVYKAMAANGRVIACNH